MSTLQTKFYKATKKQIDSIKECNKKTAFIGGKECKLVVFTTEDVTLTRDKRGEFYSKQHAVTVLAQTDLGDITTFPLVSLEGFGNYGRFYNLESVLVDIEAKYQRIKAGSTERLCCKTEIVTQSADGLWQVRKYI